MTWTDGEGPLFCLHASTLTTELSYLQKLREVTRLTSLRADQLAVSWLLWPASFASPLGWVSWVLMFGTTLRPIFSWCLIEALGAGFRGIISKCFLIIGAVSILA